MKTQRSLVAFFSVNNVEAVVSKGQVLIHAPIRRVANLVARRGAHPRGMKIGATNSRSNAKQKLLKFKIASPAGNLTFLREASRVTSITVG